MEKYLNLVLVLGAAYVLGSVPTGLWIGLVFFKKDIRTSGSGNIGATNTLRALGTVPGVIALSIDMLKGAAAVFLAGQVAGLSLHSTADATIILPLLKISAGVLAVAGHNWSLFLKFKGGKGVATSCGVFLMLTPVPTTMALAVFIIVLVTSRYVSVASMTAALSLPAAIYWRIQGDERLMLLAISLFMAILIIIRHRSNLVRLFHGEEPKIDRKVDDT